MLIKISDMENTKYILRHYFRNIIKPKMLKCVFSRFIYIIGSCSFFYSVFTFRELRCLRNTIHTNLIVTYILADTLWIITSSTTFTSTSALPDATQVLHTYDYLS